MQKRRDLLLFAVSEGFADGVALTEMDSFEKGLYAFFEEQCPELTEQLKSGRKADGALIASLKEAVGEYLKRA